MCIESRTSTNDSGRAQWNGVDRFQAERRLMRGREDM